VLLKSKLAVVVYAVIDLSERRGRPGVAAGIGDRYVDLTPGGLGSGAAAGSHTAKGRCDAGCEVLSLRAFLIGRVPVYGRLARPDYTELHQLLEDTCGLSPF